MLTENGRGERRKKRQEEMAMLDCCYVEVQRRVERKVIIMRQIMRMRKERERTRERKVMSVMLRERGEGN